MDSKEHKSAQPHILDSAHTEFADCFYVTRRHKEFVTDVQTDGHHTTQNIQMIFTHIIIKRHTDTITKHHGSII